MIQDKKRKVAEEFLSDFDVSGTKKLGNGPAPPPPPRTETQSKKFKVEESTSIAKSNGESTSIAKSNVVTEDDSLKIVEKKKKEKKKKAKSYLDDL